MQVSYLTIGKEKSSNTDRGGHHPDSGQIYAGLGTFWETDRIAVKAYAAMGLLHAAIDAAL